MKFRRIITIILILVLVAMAFTACGAPAKDRQQDQAQAGDGPDGDDGAGGAPRPEDNRSGDNQSEDVHTQPEFPVTVTDFLGNEVTIEEKPRRIISLSPANTEILFALGLDENIIGVTQWCTYPEQVAEKEKIGDFDGPNIELIVSKDPDLIVTGGYLQEDATQRFNELGITVISTECLGYDDIFKAINLIAQATGTTDNAQKLIDEINARVEEIKAKVDNEKTPKVYFNVELSTMYTCGSNTFIDELIRMAGGQNIVEEENWLRYSMEKLIEQDPDIILNGDYLASSDEIMAKPEFAGIAAVKNGRVHNLDPDIVTRPSPRVVQALEDIYNAINN